MSLKVRFHKIHLQSPECSILVALGMEQIQKLHESIYLGADLVEEFQFECTLGCFGMTNGYIYLLLPEEYNPIITAHECIHAASRIWDSRGANLTSSNDEVITYTHDTIHRMIKELYNVPT